jgi:hypothetical protein
MIQLSSYLWKYTVLLYTMHENYTLTAYNFTMNAFRDEEQTVSPKIIE